MHVSHVDLWKPIFLIVDMHNYKSVIDFTLLWVLKNQYCTSTGVAFDGGVWPLGDSYKTSRLLKRVAFGDKGCPARRYLLKQ